jgi:hypothetical protein
MKPNTSPISRFQLFVAISYVAIMLTGGTITCVVLAPLQAPDEHSHFLHATALARARISSGDCFCIRERPLSRNGMVAVAAAGLLIALLTYLTAAPVGAETGIPFQGRYFIELLPTLVALTLAPLLSEKAQVATPAWLTLGRILERSVLVFLLALLPLCFAVIEAVLLDRYYVR